MFSYASCNVNVLSLVYEMIYVYTGLPYCTEARARRLRPPRHEAEAGSALSLVISTPETWPPWAPRPHLATPLWEPPQVWIYRWLVAMKCWELREPPTNSIMSRCRGRYQSTLPPFFPFRPPVLKIIPNSALYMLVANCIRILYA